MCTSIKDVDKERSIWPYQYKYAVLEMDTHLLQLQKLLTLLQRPQTLAAQVDGLSLPLQKMI
jgi:hypothetical protein